VHPAAELQLLIVEGGEVVARGKLHCVVILKSSAARLAWRIAAPSASGDLGE